MYDKEFLESVANGTCDFEKVSQAPRLDTMEFDLDNPFAKYYRLQTVLNVMEKYENEEISIEELTSWACTYLWVLNGGFKRLPEYQDVTDFLKYKISDWIDALSFWQGEEGWEDWEKLKEVFRTLDGLYQNSDGWTWVQYNDDEDEEREQEDDVIDNYVILAKNEAEKKLLLMDSDWGEEYPAFSLVTKQEGKKTEETCREDGYSVFYLGFEP